MEWLRRNCKKKEVTIKNLGTQIGEKQPDCWHCGPSLGLMATATESMANVVSGLKQREQYIDANAEEVPGYREITGKYEQEKDLAERSAKNMREYHMQSKALEESQIKELKE